MPAALRTLTVNGEMYCLAISQVLIGCGPRNLTDFPGGSVVKNRLPTQDMQKTQGCRRRKWQ